MPITTADLVAALEPLAACVPKYSAEQGGHHDDATVYSGWIKGVVGLSLGQFRALATILSALKAGEVVLADRGYEDSLEGALITAAAWFEDYERQHREKRTTDADRKADTNAERAKFLRAMIRAQGEKM
jgi:hypothetical protein